MRGRQTWVLAGGESLQPLARFPTRAIARSMRVLARHIWPRRDFRIERAMTAPPPKKPG